MIEWKQVPWPLWFYSAVTVLGAILIEVQAHGPVSAKVLYPFVMLAWLYFLLKGVRWVWIVTAGIYVLGLVPDVLTSPLEWQGLVFGLIGLILLLLPVTRRYFSDRPAVTSL